MKLVKSLVVVALLAVAGSAAASVTVTGPNGTTTFTAYTGLHAEVPGLHEQGGHIVHVPAVPEADTWAMMAVGLGLVGLRLRRKSKNVA